MDSLPLLLVCLAATISLGVFGGEPFNVSYDHRAILINGERRLLISAGIHYPRATPQMWPDLISKAKSGGANVIQSYVFWNGHEPVKRKYNFVGRYDLVRFLKLVDEAGLMFHLRIGPYACAEWNFGGLPVWLRDIPGIVFRTNNSFFQEEMSIFVKEIVDMMKENNLFSWQGGPIILAQIENEYGNIEDHFGEDGKQYIQWAAALARSMNAGVPWVMCQQQDAPADIIDACNGFYCDGYTPNSNDKPILWTEDWNGWYTSWGDPVPWRPVEDNAFAIARFFQMGGSFHNYYMYFGGTNFGHTSGGPFVTTSYDYDAPIDEFGLLRQPKWGHFRELHAALKLCEGPLLAGDTEPLYLRLGPNQEAHVYGDYKEVRLMNDGLDGASGRCAAFLANLDTSSSKEVEFNGLTYELPPWSVSILPDCKNVAFNSAKVNAQTSVMRMATLLQQPGGLHPSLWQAEGGSESSEFSWQYYAEPIGTWSGEALMSHNLLEHLNLTKDSTDYLWYICRFEVSKDEFLADDKYNAMLSIGAMRDTISIFINKNFSGFATASTSETWVTVKKGVSLKPGVNEVALLSSTVGLQNYGAFLEIDGAGLQGQVLLTGLPSGDLTLSDMDWIYEVGLRGEMLRIYTEEGTVNVEWSHSSYPVQPSPVKWYKTYFDAPNVVGPFALDLSSMGKGEVWLNGRSLGRYWPAFAASSTGCTEDCDYRGTYTSSKCLTGCGQPTQRYHVPQSWLYSTDNLLVLFEEIGGVISEVSLTVRYGSKICAHIAENQPSVRSWLQATEAKSYHESWSVVELSCEEGFLMSEVSFASFGNPRGQCGRFEHGHCHAAASQRVVESACIGHRQCTLKVNVEEFGEDPCPKTWKSLAVEAICTHQLWLAEGGSEHIDDGGLGIHSSMQSEDRAIMNMDNMYMAQNTKTCTVLSFCAGCSCICDE